MSINTVLQNEKAFDELKSRIQGDICLDIYNRIAFSTDSSIYQIVPQCVAVPRDGRDVAEIVRFACETGRSVAARGAGSGLAGESLGEEIVIDFTRYMNQILEIGPDGEYIVCEPGVVLDDINAALAKYGRKIGPDPSSGNRAVIGGVVANNATGAHSLAYGYIADYVQEIDAVTYDGSMCVFTNDMDPAAMPDGPAKEIALGCISVLDGKQELIEKVQPKTERNRSGYNIAGICRDGHIDLAKLLAGSEGTLAVYTKIRLATVPVPAKKALVQMEFDTFGQMARAVPLVVESGASACELMDRALMDLALESLPGYEDIFPANCQACLLVEHDGDTMEQIEARIEKTVEAVGELSSGRMTVTDDAQQKRVWKSRKDAVPLLNRKRGPAQAIPFIEDVSVENRQLDKYIEGLEEIGKRYNIPMAFYGHAGDGELHVRPYLDLSMQEDVEKMQKIAWEVFELAWSLGGSVSGEHADGLVRAGFLEKQFGSEYYSLLGEIKDVFDPRDVLNPGKIINTDRDIMIKNLRAGRPIISERLETTFFENADAFRYEIEQCNGDGVCLCRQTGMRMCPVFRATGEELASSRGKVNLVRSWIRGFLNDEDVAKKEFQKLIGLCVNCKMCSVECPSAVDVSSIVLEARAKLREQIGPSRAEMALSQNKMLAKLSSLMSPLSNFVLSLPPVRFMIDLVMGIDKRRRMPKFQRGNFLKQARKYLQAQPPITEPVGRAAYFVDTYAMFNDHGLGLTVIDVLRKLGVDVTVPDQRPSPLPSIMYGDLKTARKELAYSVKFLYKEVQAGRKIVCSEPSAALCLKEELPKLVRTPEAKAVSENTVELMEYIEQIAGGSGKLYTLLDDEKSTAGRKYGYHAPCHLIAQQGGERAVRMLNSIDEIEVTDVGGGCCGLAGTCGMQKEKYDLSMQIGKDMADRIAGMDVDAILTECGACKMQIEHMTGRKVVHPVRVLAEKMGLSVRS